MMEQRPKGKMLPRATLAPVLAARKQRQPGAVVAQEPRPMTNILPGEHFIATQGVTSDISSDSVKNGEDLVLGAVLAVLGASEVPGLVRVSLGLA